MHSILTIMAIESVAPEVRTVAEVNNPRHEPHFRRAERRRAAGHLEGRLAAARPVRPLPGPVRARDRHRVRRRGLRAVPDHPARRVHRAAIDAVVGAAARASTRPRCCRSTAAAAPSSTRRATSSSEPGDDAIVVAEGARHAGAAQAARPQHRPADRRGRPERLTGRGAAGLERLDRRRQCRQAVLRIGEQHPRLGVRQSSLSMPA